VTSDDEHWYVEQNASYNEGCATEKCIVLEIHPRYRIETDDEGTRIIIEEGTPLYECLNKMTD